MSTPSWAKRYVPSSVALEHFALEAFSSPFSSPLSSAYPVPPARTPAPTTSSTSTTPAAHIPLRFIRVVLLWYEPFLTASKVPLHLLCSHVHGEALSYLNLTPLLGCTIAPPHLRRICWCSGSCAPPFPPATDMVMRLGGERNTPKQAYSPECVEGEFSEVRCSNLRAPPRRGGRISRRLLTMGVTPPNVATNRARKRSKVLRLATLNFVENFSPVPLELFLLWLLSHTKNAQQRRIRVWLIA